MNKSNAVALPEAVNGWMMENLFYSIHTLTDDEYEVFYSSKIFFSYFISTPLTSLTQLSSLDSRLSEYPVHKSCTLSYKSSVCDFATSLLRYFFLAKKKDSPVKRCVRTDGFVGEPKKWNAP